jgi:hypothetical protein
VSFETSKSFAASMLGWKRMKDRFSSRMFGSFRFGIARSPSARRQSAVGPME